MAKSKQSLPADDLKNKRSTSEYTRDQVFASSSPYSKQIPHLETLYESWKVARICYKIVIIKTTCLDPDTELDYVTENIAQWLVLEI